MEPIELRLGGNGKVLSRAVIGRRGDNQFIEYPFQLLMPDGTPQDLNGCSVVFYGTDSIGQFTSGTPTITNSSTGEITYKFSAENFSVRGEFKEAFFRVTKENGERYATQSFRLKIENDADMTQGQAQLYVSLLDEKLKDFDAQFKAFIEEKEEQYQLLNNDISELKSGIERSDEALNTLEDRIEQTNQQIGDLGKLKRMYSNSIDFGDYDYSGNPNLIIPLKASNFYTQSGVTVEDTGNALKVTFTKTDGAAFLESMKNVPALLPDTQYTLSADVTVMEGYTGKLENLRLGYRKSPNGTIILPLTGKDASVGQKTRIYTTANSSAATDPSKFDRMYFTINTTSTEPFVGTVLIENIKVEEGSTATPYQPNLLDTPYYLSKVALGENLVDPTGVTNSSYLLTTKQLNEKLLVDQTYTITLKGTKPSTQTFRCFVQYETGGSTVNLLDMKPVEGLTDVWQLTFKATKTATGINGNLFIYQVPNTSLGSCKIDWLKFEKGDTRTPNISQFKYFGEGLKDNNNPNDYSWDVTPEYTEKGLNNTVSLTEPQSVEGLKNFEDGLQIAGKEVATVPEDTGWVDLTANAGYSWGKQAQIRRIGKHIMWRGALAGTTTLGDITKLPSGFEPGGDYEMQFDLPRQSSDATQTARIYVRTDGTVGLIASTSATSNIFLSGISYFVE
ncbi:BppU family phage baseplate upper protein [Enterococcus faecium]